MSEIKITINGKEYKTCDGNYVLKVAEDNGIKIPTLCNDPRLSPYSSCYLCVVEIEGMRGLQPSCSTKVSDGMNINTENEKVTKSRKTALDLLVSDHYASCVAPCKNTCPAGVDVQGYISLIEKGKYQDAVSLIKEVNPLPAICGRVCVRPCELACNRNNMDEGTPVGIDYMKRFVSDFDLKSEKNYKPDVEKSTGKNIAIIGAGPGGLSAAYFLQQKGHQCDIFEANNHAGGWLRYGIPEYRLPNDLLDREIETITEIGTKIYLNKNLGGNLGYAEIKNKYDAVIITIGSQRGTLLRAKGEEAEGVFSGIDFLRNMEQTGQKYNFAEKTVVVVGGGNTAMDCCRTSVRCGAEKTYIVYRRTEKEMPANPIEIHESKLEGVEYLFLTNPTQVNQTADGKVKSMTLLKMKLGKPDASGRRRPVPIEGSEFELKADYILAAIGQKTDVNFIDDINKHTNSGELKLNRWGDIDANPKTLQTGIPNVFAAGDGVTGPATIIEAIAQAGIAANSCHQYLTGQEIKPKQKEFLSKKSNFKTITSKDFQGHFAKQMREEMPVLDAGDRSNFNEVELGYTEDMAKHEAMRCFECGCSEYFTCDLKRYCTDYEAEQEKFKGEFHERSVDFSHPYIEIDNNKCILCSRCVRICDEVAGTTALGLIERGFETYVAPSMGKSLTGTNCETCGLCISTCPTGAISENFKFKPGPVKLESFETISNFGSSGEKITVNHYNNYVMKITGAKGIVNKNGNIGRKSKFAYQYFNDKKRLLKPLLKTENGDFKEISFEEAYNIIETKINEVSKNENVFFAGARLSVEEQYLIKKLAQNGTNFENFGSFHYFGRGGRAYQNNALKNVHFDQIKNASRIYIFGAELNYDDCFVSFIVNNARKTKNIPVELISTKEENKYSYKADNIYNIKSYYCFTKAIISYIAENKLYDKKYINNNFRKVKKFIKRLEKFETCVTKSGLTSDFIIDFAKKYNEEKNAILIFSEKQISGNCSKELLNLAMITGKIGKFASGIISLKEKNNSQGLFENGFCKNDNVAIKFHKENYKNVFIFDEDPVGCAIENSEITDENFNVKKIFKLESANEYFKEKLKTAKFVVVRDYFISETGKLANLILPASMPVETGGHFVNTQKLVQKFDKKFPAKIEMNNCEQTEKITSLFGVDKKSESIDEIYKKAKKEFPKNKKKLRFEYTNKNNYMRLFNFGCDFLEKQFDKEFNESF